MVILQYVHRIVLLVSQILAHACIKINHCICIGNMQEALNGTMNNGTQNCEPEHSKEVNDIWRAISIVMGVLLLLFGILGLAVFICVRKSRQTKEYPIHNNEAITHCPV